MLEETILREFAAKNVLVTGGTGLIGRQVVDILVAAGARVRVASLDRIVVNDRAQYVTGDLSSYDFCAEMVRDMDFVCHLAGVQGTVQTSASKLASHFVPTLMVNTNVLEAARRNNIRKLVYTSSIGAYEDGEVLRESGYRIESTPMAFAGWAKRMAELQIHAYKVQYGMNSYSIVRLANIYGPGDNFDPATAMVIPALMSRILRGEDPLVVWGDGRAVRDFLYSRDAAEGIIRALHYGTGGEFVNIGSGTGHSIRDVVSMLKTLIPFEYRFDETKPSGSPRRIMDIAKATNLLGFFPATDLREGLRLTWEWFRSHSEEHKQKQNYFSGENR